MGSKYRWFDFAASKGYSADNLDALLADIQGKPATSPSSRSLGSSKEKAEKADSSQGGRNSSGKKAKCVKGNSCGATCIFHNDKCIMDLPAGVQSPVSQVRDRLEKLVKSGKITEDEAASYFGRLAEKSKSESTQEDEEDQAVTFTKGKAKEIEATYEKFKQQFMVNGKLDEKALDEALNYNLELAVAATYTEREKAIPASVKEIEGTQQRREYLKKYSELQEDVQKRKDAGNPYTPEELKKKLEPLTAERRIRPEPTMAEKEFFLALLPKQEVDYLETAGALLKSPNGGRFGEDTSTSALPVSYGPLGKQTRQEARNRALLLVGVYHMEDGRDFGSGVRMPITWMDMEHNIPAEVAGKAAEQGCNFSFFRTGSNVGRGSTPYIQWWEARVKSEGYEFDKNNNLTPESRNRVQNNFTEKMNQIFFKNDVENRAARAKTGAQIRELYEQAKAVSDKALREKLLTKIIAFNLNTIETVGGGIQSHGRGEKRWYWFGKDVAGSEQLSSKLLEKLASLHEEGNQDKIRQFREILNSGSIRVKEQVNRRVKPDPKDIDSDTGLPFVRVKGERGSEVRAIVKEVRDQIFNEIMSL
jgi:hypothetical protein